MDMMIVGARAGEQLLMISGTGVPIGEDLFEGQSWTKGVVLLGTVGVVLLRCAGVLYVMDTCQLEELPQENQRLQRSRTARL